MARLLVLDDSSENRDRLRSALGAGGHEVEWVTGVADALGRIREFQPELVLVNNASSGINVAELTARLPSASGTQQTPLLFYFHDQSSPPPARTGKSASGRPKRTLPWWGETESVPEGSKRPAEPAANKSKQTPSGAPSVSSDPANLDQKSLDSLLARVIEDTNNAIHAKDLSGRYLLFNQAAAKLTGIASEQVIGRTDLELWAPATAEQIVRDDRRAMTGESFTIEEELTFPGGPIHLLTSKGPLRDTNGRIFGIQAFSIDITKQRRDERSLRESEAKHKRQLEDQTEVVFRVDANDKLQFANPMFVRLFGSWESNRGPESWERFLLPEEVPAARVALAGMSMNNPVIRFESRVRTIDGQIRWMEFVCRVIQAGEHSLKETQFVGRDCTARKEAEDLVSLQHEVTRLFARTSDDRNAFADFLEIVCVSGGWFRGEIWLSESNTNQLKMECEWSRGRGADSRQKPVIRENRSGENASAMAGLLTGKSADPVWFHDRADDRDFDSAAAEPLKKAGSRVFVPLSHAKSCLGVMILSDERPRETNDNHSNLLKSLAGIAGQHLVRNRDENQLRLFRTLIDNSPDCIEVIDFESGEILDVNDRACKMHGYTREEYLRLAIEDVDPLVKGQPWKKDPTAEPTQARRPFESTHRRKDGSLFPVEVTLSEVTLDRRYLIAIVRDISERKAMEDQFRQAQKMEALGRLASGVAHDFNNLLTVIGGYCQILQRHFDSGDPASEMIREVIAAGERATSLTRQLLAFSRKSNIEPKRIELTEVLRGIGRMLDRIVDDDAEIILFDHCRSSAIMADQGQIEQVIVNLVVNARDSMPNGGQIRLTVDHAFVTDAEASRHLDARPGAHVRLTVTDSGCGMDQATISRIFEPFFSTKGERGTGLGLSTAHGIITQLGGFIRVISQPGSGSSFIVHIPKADDDSGEITPAKSAEGESRGSELILLVEDQSGLRKLTRHLLLSFGYRVLEAENGLQGLEIIRREGSSISLVITDVIMPQMGGGSLYRQARAENPGLKFLFISGYHDDAFLRQGIMEKEVSYLAKPFSPSELSREVRRIIDAADDRGRDQKPTIQSL